MSPTRIAALAFLVLLMTPPDFARVQAVKPLDDADRTRVVNAAARLLEERYVFPDVGKKCGDHIRAELQSGAFAGVDDPEAFARKLTEALQSISHDKHMRVRVRAPGGPAGLPDDPAVRRYRMRRSTAEGNYGFVRAEVMEGNVGYLEITGFPPVELARPTAAAAMKFLENVDALIIDLRRNGGGNPSTIQYVCSYFFGEKTHLNSLYWREGNRTEEFWTLDSIEGKRRADLPLYVLTSRYTFSGGEEFAYNLKTRKRALLLGETTGGGANPGGFFPLDPPIGMFVPTGRAINPVTGINWEGTGVEPDVQCDSAKALEQAFARATTAAGEHRKAMERRVTQAAAAMKGKIDEAERLMTGGNTSGAETVLRAALDEGRTGEVADEVSINEMGYGYLQAGKIDMAIQAFAYNVRAFPESWNVYDSLGEAYKKSGNTQLAIENYRKSLRLNPNNAGAREALRSLGVTD